MDGKSKAISFLRLIASGAVNVDSLAPIRVPIAEAPSAYELLKSPERPATVLNSLQEVVRAGGSVGIPGLYVTGDPGGIDANAKIGALSIRIGLGWAKSCSFHTGQCPVLRYNRQLMQAILHDKVQIAKACNVTMINLDEAPKGYQDFDKGAAKKFVIDPHGTVK